MSLIAEEATTLYGSREAGLTQQPNGNPLSAIHGKRELERSQSTSDLKSAAASAEQHGAALEADSDSSPTPKRPRQQVRRRSTLSWLNESGAVRRTRLLELVTKRIPSSFFSIHAPSPDNDSDGDQRPDSEDTPSCLYVSETVHQSMNPDFKFVDPVNLQGTRLGVLERFVLRVWTRSSAGDSADEQFGLLLELDVNLMGLQWIGQSVCVPSI